MKYVYIYKDPEASKRSDGRVGHNCATCKMAHRWPAYVFAHWDMPLQHTCDCGEVSQLLSGTVTRITAGVDRSVKLGSLLTAT